MGVNQTSELYKGFIFDGIDSKGFGVYISGAGVYNAPERDIEAVEIPGRNGSYILDNGRFHNITVTYPAGMFGQDGEDFADGIRKLRNALASRKGYCKLIDEYNPLEYRMAVYRGGLEVDPAAVNGDNKAAQFDITFECKPQRFLVSGDIPVAVASGDTITNMTLFDAKPVLMADGYGNIVINDETIAITQGVVGDVILANAKTITYPYNHIHVGDQNDIDYTVPNYVDGDVTVHGVMLIFTFNKSSEFTKFIDASLTVSGVEDTYNDPPTVEASGSYTSTKCTLTINVGDITMNGTERTVVVSTHGAVDATRSGGLSTEYYINPVLIIRVKPTGIEFTFSISNIPSTESSEVTAYNVGEVTGYSSELAEDGTIYIDLDICEAYKPVNGEIIGLNSNVYIPADPPVLKPGANEIQFDNTVTQLEIVPRWWEV